jgi:DNA mismatch repair protein MutL
LVDRLRLFFGAEVCDFLYTLEARQGSVRLYGQIADPACERGNAKLQYLFVNGRWIRDRSLGHALQEAYRGLLMTGRYAVAFLFVELPPEQVDVNVHPTKVEVRFRDAQALYHLVLATVRERLRAQNLTARLQPPAVANGKWPVSSEQPGGPASAFRETLPFANVPLPQEIAQASKTSADGTETLSAAVPSVPLQAAAASLRPLGPRKAIQLYDSYLVLETAEGMLVIDQHALHERILFEQLKKRVRSGSLEVQRLLIPEPVEVPAEQAARTLEHREALQELGLGVEDFGGGTLLLTSYPAILGKRSPRSTLLAVVDHLVAKERVPNREQLLNDLLSRMACHAAVRAGDPLTPEEIEALIAQRDLATDAHHCPHGRPTALLFSRQELERQFRRV